MIACVVGLIDTPIGELSIGSFHLTPYSEAQRIPEIDLILNEQKNNRNKILMGDINFLSRHDNYDQSIIKFFNDM